VFGSFLEWSGVGDSNQTVSVPHEVHGTSPRSLVHRPWPLLTETGEDWGVTMGISWVDIVFDSFLEMRSGRFESNHL